MGKIYKVRFLKKGVDGWTISDEILGKDLQRIEPPGHSVAEIDTSLIEDPKF